MRHTNSRLLVVGTTPDYIDLIRRSNPGRAVFLTDASVRVKANEPKPGRDEELLCDLGDSAQIHGTLLNYLCQEKITLDSICCFDCERMDLAARIARDLNLSYPSVETIHNCRNKFVCKQLWKKQGLLCPETKMIYSVEDITGFQAEFSPCVIKPLSGTGSELVFKCQTKDDSRKALGIITESFDLKNPALAAYGFSPEVLAEEFIDGPEFSCDFILENSTVEIIRLTGKIKAENTPFGTISGYILTEHTPPGVDPQKFRDTLVKSAESLGLERAICMLDFIVREGEIVLIELSPRPGGDCLPFLLRQVSGLDILTMALDFAQKHPVLLFNDRNQQTHACVRLHAAEPGVLDRVSIGKFPDELGVVKHQTLRSPGHIVRMPPDDYDSWLLGHVIFKCNDKIDPATQAAKILDHISIEIRPNHEN